jgi:NADPH-dependent ferric siderophore reductase
MATKLKPRLTQVISVTDISPHLRRIVLGGDDLLTFPVGEEGAHVKVILPLSSGALPNLSFDDSNRPLMRSYTIQRYDAADNQLTLDFVVNRHQGPGTNWALSAKVGDALGIAGPEPKKLTHVNAACYLLVGELTSINMVRGFAKTIRAANAGATIYGFIQVPTAADITMDPESSRELNLQWLVEETQHSTLSEQVRGLAGQLPSDTQVFMGLEANEARRLRGILLNEIGLNRSDVRGTGYWKQGVDADGLAAQKQQMANAE